MQPNQNMKMLTAVGGEPKPSSPYNQRMPEPTAAPRTGFPGLAGKRVVICEDEGVTQLQLRRALTRAGMTIVGTAINGLEGLEQTLREHPDIVLMDIRMPVMDGLEAARRILAVMPVCIVLLTAYSDAEYQQQAISYGASGYLIKPLTSDLLLPLMLQAYEAFQAGSGKKDE